MQEENKTMESNSWKKCISNLHKFPVREWKKNKNIFKHVRTQNLYLPCTLLQRGTENCVNQNKRVNQERGRCGLQEMRGWHQRESEGIHRVTGSDFQSKWGPRGTLWGGESHVYFLSGDRLRRGAETHPELAIDGNAENRSNNTIRKPRQLLTPGKIKGYATKKE